jgi:hypothetical protein
LVNPASNFYCGTCGAPLTNDARDFEEYVFAEIQRDPLYKTMVQSALIAAETAEQTQINEQQGEA